MEVDDSLSDTGNEEEEREESEDEVFRLQVHWGQRTRALLNRETTKLLLDEKCSDAQLALLTRAFVNNDGETLFLRVDHFLRPECLPHLTWMIQHCRTLRTVTLYSPKRSTPLDKDYKTMGLMDYLMAAVARSTIHTLTLTHTFVSVSSLLHLLESNQVVRELKLDNILSDCCNEDTDTLVPICQGNRSITHLSLAQDWNVSPQLYLTVGLHLASHLSTLHLSGWCDGLILKEYLEESSATVLNLLLCSANIDTEDGEEAVSAICASKTLRVLSLKHCEFEEPNHLRSLLRSTQSLIDIEMHGTLGSAWPSFCLGMRENRSIIRASFEDIEWDDDDGRLWIENHPTVRELSLRNCSVSGASLIYGDLTGLSLLEPVNWDVDDVDQFVCQGLALMPNLRRLHLSCIELGDEGTIKLAQWLRENTSLVALELTSCDVADEGFVALLDVTTSNRSLLDLSLPDCVLGDAQHLVDLLPHIRSLQSLILGGISCVKTDLLHASLDQNQSLTDLRVGLSDRDPVKYYGLRNRCHKIWHQSTSLWPNIIRSCLACGSGGPSVVFGLISSRAQDWVSEPRKRRRL